MKYYELIIYFNEAKTSHQKVSAILAVEPLTNNNDTFWCYQLIEKDGEASIDFVGLFLDLLEPNLNALAAEGIEASDILFWLKYEYDSQCALGLDADDLKRLGQAGIALNIDCIEAQQKTKRLYTAWGMENDKFPNTLISGTKPIISADGEIDPECEKAFYTIEACTWEEAMSIHFLRQGFTTYQPKGEAEPCPKCRAVYYPLGSGKCWQCGYKC